MEIRRFSVTFSANGVSDPFGLNDADAVGLIVDYGTGISAGTVTLEGAPGGDYAGTWATLATAAYTSGSPIAVASANTTLSQVVGRLRMASIAGGTVTATVSLHAYNR